MTIKLFGGFDARESIGFHVFVDSVMEHATAPVSITALGDKGMPHGSNAFTYSRFLVPWLCEFKGHAIFCDASDMLMLADIAELDALFDPTFAVQCVRHPAYSTKHPIKYVGTSMQCPNVNYLKKQWASVMIVNAEHPHWAGLDPAKLDSIAGRGLLQFVGLADELIGALPNEWNRIVDEGQPIEGAKLLHFTAGLPAFPHYAGTPGASQWFAARDRMLETA